jgi:hypothetical protein
MVSDKAKKDIHSHPGDAFGYGAAVYFPAGQLKGARHSGGIPIRQPKYFRRARGSAMPVLEAPDSPHEAVPPASIPADGALLPGRLQR